MYGEVPLLVKIDREINKVRVQVQTFFKVDVLFDLS